MRYSKQRLKKPAILKFGAGIAKVFDDMVNRWISNLRAIGKTFASMEFNWRRWVLREHTTQFILADGYYFDIIVQLP